MSTQINDVERAEMMLSLGMNENGDPLSNDERAELEAYVDKFKAAEPVTVEVMPTEATQVAGAPTDLQALIQAEVAKAVGGTVGQAQPQTFDEILARVDPRDSDAALAMFQWLSDNGRLGVVGTLNGGGYLLHYSEPKGTTKAGYTPGGTQGGRMVDQAVQKAKDSGAKPRQTGMCSQCWSAVEQLDDGSVVTDDDTKSAVCSSGGPHNFNA